MRQGHPNAAAPVDDGLPGSQRLLYKLCVHLLRYSSEQALFVAVMVIQRTHGHASIGADVAQRCFLKALGAEPAQRGHLQCGLGRSGILFAAVAFGGGISHG